MSGLTGTPANQKKMAQLKEALKVLLIEGLRRGFFGEMAVKMTVQDGTIQRIVWQVEQDEK